MILPRGLSFRLVKSLTLEERSIASLIVEGQRICTKRNKGNRFGEIIRDLTRSLETYAGPFRKYFKKDYDSMIETNGISLGYYVLPIS